MRSCLSHCRTPNISFETCTLRVEFHETFDKNVAQEIFIEFQQDFH